MSRTDQTEAAAVLRRMLTLLLAAGIDAATSAGADFRRLAGALSAYASPPPSLLAVYESEPALAVHHADLRTALRELPPRMRAAVVFRYFYDLDVADTADALGCSEGTVKSQTAQALDRLRTVLAAADLPLTGVVR